MMRITRDVGRQRDHRRVARSRKAEIVEIRRRLHDHQQVVAHTTDGVLRRAIAEQRLIRFIYKGRLRVAEPHDYGVQKGIRRALVYQLRAEPRRTDKTTGWRLLDAARIEAPVVLEETFRGSRGAEHRRHYQWDEVYARVA